MYGYLFVYCMYILYVYDKYKRLDPGLSNLRCVQCYSIYVRNVCSCQHSSAGFLPECIRGHQHQYRMTRPAKTDASILVGGCESSAGRRLMQYVPVRWSHKHCICSRLPLAGQHRQGIMWTSTSWYHGLLILLRDFICWWLWKSGHGTEIEEQTCERSPRMCPRRLLLYSLPGWKKWVQLWFMWRGHHPSPVRAAGREEDVDGAVERQLMFPFSSFKAKLPNFQSL